MAESGYLTIAQFRPSVLKIEKVVQIALNGSGVGSTVVNLDRAFTNAPVIVVAKPFGSTVGVYKAGYLAAGPSITITTDAASALGQTPVVGAYLGVATTSGNPASQVAVAESAGFFSQTVEVILYAIEPP